MAAAASPPSIKDYISPYRIGEEYTPERFRFQKELTIRLTSDVITLLGKHLDISIRLKLRKQLLVNITDLTFESRSDLHSCFLSIHSRVFRFVQSLFPPKQAHFPLLNRFENSNNQLYPHSKRKIFSGFTPIELERLIFRLAHHPSLSQIFRIEEFRLLLLDPSDPKIKKALNNNCLENVISALTEEGFLDRALLIARQFYVDLSEISSHDINLEWMNYKYDRYLQVIVKALIKKSEYVIAEKLARSIHIKFIRMSSLIELAGALLASGQKEKALRISEFLANDMEELTACSLQRLSKLYTKLGNEEMARVAIRMIAQGFLAEEKGDEEKAAFQDPPPLKRYEIRARITGVEVLLEDSNFEGAIEVTKKIRDPDAKRKCYEMLIDALIKIGAFEKALSIANKLLDPEELIKRILMTSADISTIQEVLELARTIENQEIKTAAVLAISIKIGESGDSDGANRLANSIMEAASSSRAINKDECVIS